MGLEDIAYDLLTKHYDQEKLKETPEIFLFDFEELINQYTKYGHELTEEEVLKTDSNVNIFCKKFENFETVKNLFKKYNELKNEMKIVIKDEKASCRSRREVKYKREIKHKFREYNEDDFEKFVSCTKHGIEEYYEEYVIEEMKTYIHENRKTVF